ncbi:MAG: hypothetical protein JW717_12895 [Marinilabiliaceae bacterium]|nr:hypothetical protein [Marinilabiliaceae bacterium]
MTSTGLKIKKGITQRLINVPGWRTSRKILVIESDDWGSIRMPSTEVYNRFIENGFKIENSQYNRLDSLESNDDLTCLFDTLTRFNDKKGHSPVITANCVVGNPDFNKIRESGFEQYHYESVEDTIKDYSNRNKVLTLWKEGCEKGFFRPQFHGREHVNVVRWMEALKSQTPEMMFTFDNNTTFSGSGDYNFMEVLDYNTSDDLVLMKDSLKEGLDLFEKIFGFRSKSFIPPCYTWDSNVEKTLAENGVKYIQGLVIQSVPTGSFGNYTRKYHFMGSKNKFGQTYLIRNSFFEPSLAENNDPVGECLNRINLAFKWHKPAIIGSHRLNYIGSLVEKNRSDNLHLLTELLSKIVKLWPDVEFMSSDQLGDLITGNN